MTNAITVTVDDARVQAVLGKIAAGTRNAGPLWRMIGEDLVQSTKERFATSTAPDGSKWDGNSQTTMDAYIGRISGAYKKNGELSKKGAKAIAGKRPLVGRSKMLAEQIHYNVTDGGLEVGSSMIYSAMQQFGGRKADWPHLWGDIPARPFIGLSDKDVDNIEASALDYLTNLTK